MNSYHVIIVVAIFVSSSPTVEAHFTCVGTCYKGKFIEERHVTSDKALIGHSFINLTASAPHQCLSACVSNCRCLAFQLQDTRCELLEQDRLLTPQDFHQVQGYTYFDVNQALDRNVSNIVYTIYRFTSGFNFTLPINKLSETASPASIKTDSAQRSSNKCKN